MLFQSLLLSGLIHLLTAQAEFSPSQKGLSKSILGELFSVPLLEGALSKNFSPFIAGQNATQNTSTSLSSSEKSFHSRNQTKEAEDRLQWLFTQLKSFISQSHFDTFRFGVVLQRLDDDVYDIVEFAHNVAPSNPRLSRMIAFIERMYDVMAFSLEVLSYYDYVGSAENYLLNRVVDLNVRLLAMCDSTGYLDLSIEDYSEKLLHHWRNLFIWEDNFKTLSNVPEGLQALFLSQVQQAQETANALLSQIPRNLIDIKFEKESGELIGSDWRSEI